MKFSIKGRSIGEGEPCFIIAEAGVNHNGNMETAKRLVEVAKDAGADAVKFQTFKAETLVSRDAEKADYQKESTGTGSQYEMIKCLELREDDFKILSRHAEELGIIFLSTPFDIESANMLNELAMPAFKIASGEITNFPLLRHIASFGKPIILSTGMATMDEIKEALECLENSGAREIAVLHCITSYPAGFDELNLRVIRTMRGSLEYPIGYSDHSEGIYAPIAAVALGSCVIEKHFTMDKGMEGPDHRASLEPDELKEMVCAVKLIERALGNGIKKPTLEENEIKIHARKSIIAKLNIQEGMEISEEMIEVKRPGTGLEPKYIDRIIGRKAKRSISKSSNIQWEDLE